MSAFIPKTGIFSVDCPPIGKADQITVRINGRALTVPACRSDDDDYEVLTYLKTIEIDRSGHLTFTYSEEKKEV